MFRFSIVVVALAIEASAYAQGASQSRPNRQTAAPAAQTADDPNDVATVPRNVQKWIEGAVDDILTGADKVVDPGKKTR